MEQMDVLGPGTKRPRRAQACDACRLRKVKCNGEFKCQQCNHLNLSCVYSAPRRRHHSHKRGNLISQYKTEGRESHVTSPPVVLPKIAIDQSSPDTHSQSASVQGSTPHESELRRLERLPSIISLDLLLGQDAEQMSPPLANRDFFLNFLPDYESAVFPVNPIISSAEARQSILDMGLSREACTFVYSLVAVTMILTIRSSQYDNDTLERIGYWVEQAINSRQSFRSTAEISPRAVMTSEFVHIALMGLQRTDLAFYYLRDAINLIQLLRLDDPTSIQGLPPGERSRRQHMYWEAFVHERYMAIACYRPIAMDPLPTLPEYDPDTPYQDGFIQIIKLFRIIDKDLVRHWIDSRHGSSATKGVTVEWIQAKQQEIDAEPAGNDDMVPHLTFMQQSDLIITKHWIRTLVWQLALSNCLLTTSDAHQSMSLTFPLHLSSNLRHMLTRMSKRDIEVHGSGIQTKLFELTDAIANVLLATPATSTHNSTQHVEDFVFLVKFISSLPTFDAVQRKILQDKCWELESRSFADGEMADVAGLL